MIRRDEAVIGRRVRWQPDGVPAEYGVITDIIDDEILILFDDGGDGRTFIDSEMSAVYPA